LQASVSKQRTFQIASTVSNLGAARQIIARWASILRSELDAANGR
jgi:hypothetical protein